MANRLRAIVPDYPIQQYFGDYQHFVQNKAKEWGDICGADHHVCTLRRLSRRRPERRRPTGLVRTGATTRLNRFIDHYAQPPGNPSQPAPQFDVTASLQVCPQNAGWASPPTSRATRSRPAASRRSRSGTLQLDMHGNQTTVEQRIAEPARGQRRPGRELGRERRPLPGRVELEHRGPGRRRLHERPAGAVLHDARRDRRDRSTTRPPTRAGPAAELAPVRRVPGRLVGDGGPRRAPRESASGKVTYQLHGNGWRFPAGHRVRIEVAQDDDPYLRASTVPSTATISHVTLGSRCARTPPTRARGGDAAARPAGRGLPACTAPNRAARPAARVRLVQPAAAVLEPAHRRHLRRQRPERRTWSAPSGSA